MAFDSVSLQRVSEMKWMEMKQFSFLPLPRGGRLDTHGIHTNDVLIK